MQTVTVKLKDEKVDFFVELLKKLNYITDIQFSKSTLIQSKIDHRSYIRLPKGKPAISDFAGLWSHNPKTLEQIRNKAWKRN